MRDPPTAGVDSSTFLGENARALKERTHASIPRWLGEKLDIQIISLSLCSLLTIGLKSKN